jgi:hypothetical protein
MVFWGLPISGDRFSNSNEVVLRSSRMASGSGRAGGQSGGGREEWRVCGRRVNKVNFVYVLRALDSAAAGKQENFPCVFQHHINR